ncbi:uncharacterized protein LOC112545206 [Pelodiscus sinensis]|uniref:uncharacterized protein LOC112545206 n=1 Tax=Pelodiscus sinensis TaxID=13735 RepID=UPI003F6C3DFB
MSAYDQFAIAMLLSREACEKSTTAEQEGATIEDKLLKIWEEDRLDKEPYVYTDNFLVATVKRDEHKGWHAEAVLVGTMETDKKKRKSWVYNFLKVFLDNRKQTYPPDNSCFIFFSLISPCLDYCLNPESDTNILKALQDSLQGYDPRFQAFAFEHVYKEDQPKGQIKLWEAWRQIPMPLFRCSFDQPESCIKCTGDIDTNECLDDIGFLPPDSFFS